MEASEKKLSASPAGVVKPLEIVPTDRLERLIGTGDPAPEEAHDMAVEILNHRQAARIMSAIEPAGVGVETALTEDQIERAEWKLAEVLAGYEYTMPVDGMRRVLTAARAIHHKIGVKDE